MKEWFKNIEGTKQLVIKYLKEYPHARDSDVELFYLILKDYYRAIPHNKKQAYMRSSF